MLAFGMKKAPDKLSLKKLIGEWLPLKQLAEDQSAFIEDLAGWRDRMRAANFGDKSGGECRDDMLCYYKLATQAADLFRGHSLPISFRWQDSFDKDVICAGSDFGYEAACALFNVAAATSFMATSEDRGSEEGMKKACTYFQEAAGILNAVKDLVNRGAWPDVTPDLSINLLDALQFLMLAQAQKCFYEKATRAGMKDAIVVKITAECAGLYKDASSRLGHATIGGSGSKDWLEVVEWNKKLFEGMQHHYAASAHEEAHEYGKQLSRLTYATNRVAEAVLLCKKAPKELQEQFVTAHTVVNERRARAKKDNDMVYNEKVPPVETLPALERKAMVKPVHPLDLLEVPPLPEPSITRQPTPSEPSAVAEVMQHLALSDAAADAATLAAATAAAAAAAAHAAAAAPPAPPYALASSYPVPGAAAGPPPPSFEAAVDSSVQQLMQMGFSQQDSVAALQKAQGSVEGAMDHLLSG